MNRSLLFASILALSLGACSSIKTEPAGEIDQGADEMMPGPGLFSGKDGEFTLFTAWPDEDDEAGEETGKSSSAGGRVVRPSRPIPE